MWVGGSSLAGAWSPCRAWTGARVWQPHFSPHQPPLCLTVAPHLPQKPPGARQEWPGQSHAESTRSEQGVSAEGLRSGQGRVASVSHLRFPPHPGSCGGQEGLPTQPVKVRVSSPGSGEGSHSPNSRSRRQPTEPALQPPPPTPTPTQPDPGSGPSGFSKLLGQPGAAAVLSSSRRSCP